MSDQYTEVTSESWFSRLGSSIKGVITGLIIFVLAFPLLFWNEGRAVKRAKALDEGAGLVQTIPAETVDSQMNGKLVHMTGMATTTETLTDGPFGVTVTGIKLIREVEMYQWEESSSSKSKKKLGGSKETKTTYSYKKVWSNNVIDSSNFKVGDGHQNPGAMPFESQTLKASDVTLGAYKLNPAQINSIGNAKPLPIKEVPESLKAKAILSGQGLYMGVKDRNKTVSAPVVVPMPSMDPSMTNPNAPVAATPTPTPAPVVKPEANPADPQIGDVRVTFKVVEPQTVSLVAKLNGNTFEPYVTSNGGDILLTKTGTHSAANMFAAAQSANTMLTWGLRVLGFFLMFIGLNMIFKPMSVLGDVVPFIGSLIGMGTSLVSFLISFVCSLITIAIAWIFYRPVLGVILLVLAGAGIFLILKKRKPVSKVAPQAT